MRAAPTKRGIFYSRYENLIHYHRNVSFSGACLQQSLYKMSFQTFPVINGHFLTKIYTIFTKKGFAR